MKCTICNEEMIVKSGKRIDRTGTYQMYFCKKCGHRQKGEKIVEEK